MVEFDKNPLEHLKESLETRALLKQRIWHISQEAFKVLESESKILADKLTEEIKTKEVVVEVINTSDHEFNMKFGSDVLVFALQTNIVTFEEGNHLLKTKQIKKNSDLAYFGQIMIYDFLADSIKYERTGDSGYLIARILININNHMYIEGVRELHYLFPGTNGTEANHKNISLLVKKALSVTIESDLIGKEFNQIQSITLGEKLTRNKEVGHGSKIGFRMSLDNPPEG